MHTRAKQPSGPGPNGCFSIGELAREFRVTLRTLRFYEDRGLVVPSRQGAARVYTAGDRALFAAVFKAKRLGFSLAEIEAMLKADEPRSTVGLDLSLKRIDAQIAFLEQRLDDTATAILELKRERAKLTAT